MDFKTSGLFRDMFLIAAGAASLFAQTSGTGAITGTVTDASGAVIPNSSVVATNADTNQQRTAATGSDGSYRFALLQPGTYNLRFSATGFKTVEVPRITVAVTETPVLDQRLELGTQAEQVTVEANAEAIQTTNATLGTVLSANQVTALPLTMRNYTNSLGLSAGVSAGVTNAGQLGKAGMDFSSNGAGVQSNNIQIDGMNVTPFDHTNSNVDSYNTSASRAVPSPDALQEFKVQTAAYDAGYGRNSGANVNAVTKSGTNAFHGSAFEFFRNTHLNANSFFLNLAGKPKGILNQNQYGGVIGGPIKRDKLFFFFSYQGTGQKNGLAIQGNDAITLPPIPTGSRSNTSAFQAALGAAFCPTNHPGASQYSTLRGGVQVACDGSTINPVAVNLLQGTFPSSTPNVGGQNIFPGSSNGAFQNTSLSYPAIYSEYQELANVDYLLSSKNTLALRFFDSYSPANIAFLGGSGTAASTVPGFGDNSLLTNVTSLAKLTTVLTSSMVNEARVSMHRDVGNFPPSNSGLSDHQFGITPVSPYQDNTIPGFMSSINITGTYNLGNSTLDGSDTITTAYQAADQISWTRGRHTIRAGLEVEQVRLTWNYPGLGKGILLFPTFDDFLIGRAGCTPGDSTCSVTTPGVTNGTLFSSLTGGGMNGSDALTSAGNPHLFYVKDYAAFVQDDIKISQHLTLNIGLRYEYDGMLQEVYGVQTNVWPSAILSVPVPGSTAATGTLAGWVVPSNYKGTLLPGLTKASNISSLISGPPNDNFAPRIGFALQPPFIRDNKLVVRGGYGFFYDRVTAGSWEYGINNAPPNAPPTDSTGVANYYSALAVPFKVVPPGTFAPRWINFATATGSSINQTSFGPNWETPLIYSYNLGIQYNFLPSWVLEAGYSGSHGIHQQPNATVNINSALLASAANPINGLTTNTVSNAVLRVPYLGYSALNDGCTCFTNKYNSLQVTLRKQLSHGVLAQAAYTYARSFANSGLPDPNNFALNYGPNTAIHPHRVVISYTWDLPFGKPQGFVGKLVTGWNLSGITTIQNGTPLTITDGRGGTIYALSASNAQMAPGKTYGNIATPGGLESRLGGATGGCGYFASPTTPGNLSGVSCGSLSAFVPVGSAIAPDGTVTNGTGWGNTGVGIVLGPGQFNFDTALIKNTKVGGIHEDSTLQFRAEFFNALNHAQFSNPVSAVVSAGTFGQITSTTVNPRVVQFALKYIF